MSILNNFALTGKTAIVTGGGRGLGRGMAEGLAEAGAKVLIIGSSASAEKTAAECRQKGLSMLALQGDLLDQEQVPAIFEKGLRCLRRPHRHLGQQCRNTAPSFLRRFSSLRLERCHKSQFKYGISAVPACRTQYVAPKIGENH